MKNKNPFKLLVEREPAVLIAIAAAVVILGVDLAALSDVVTRLLELITIAGAGLGTRSLVSPVSRDESP